MSSTQRQQRRPVSVGENFKNHISNTNFVEMEYPNWFQWTATINGILLFVFAMLWVAVSYSASDSIRSGKVALVAGPIALMLLGIAIILGIGALIVWHYTRQVLHLNSHLLAKLGVYTLFVKHHEIQEKIKKMQQQLEEEIIAQEQPDGSESKRQEAVNLFIEFAQFAQEAGFFVEPNHYNLRKRLFSRSDQQNTG